jgi:hypothetical protein
MKEHFSAPSPLSRILIEFNFGRIIGGIICASLTENTYFPLTYPMKIGESLSFCAAEVIKFTVQKTIFIQYASWENLSFLEMTGFTYQ